MLAVIETHPVQYHAPVYRALQQTCGVPVTAIYGSDFSVVGSRDAEFGVTVAWDTDLLSGYSSTFLSRVANGGATRADVAKTRGLRAVLRQLRPDAVLIMGYSPRFHRVAWFEARRAARALLFRGETSDAATARGRLRAQMRASALRLAYRTCDRLLYIGRQSYDHFRRLGVADARLVFSPYCVDASTFQTTEADRLRLREPARRALGLTPDDLVLIFSGKLALRKGVDLILPAIRRLSPDVARRAVVVFLGSGECRERLCAQAAEAPPVRTIHLGFRNQSELSPYYHAADGLVLPSRSGETWGLVVNEALHHGVPCVISDAVGCARDLIVDARAGRIFASESVDDFARAIAEVAPLVGRADVRDACRTVVAGYSVDRAAAGIAQAYQAALA